MPVTSKLPDVGTTIFTVMSRRARELGALNVGQGFPDYAIDPRLAELVAAGDGRRPQPVRADGRRRRVCGADRAQAAALSTTIAVDPESEITVTVGGTESLYDAVQAVVGPGDEAIVFDPAYDSYEPAVRLAGGALRSHTARCRRRSGTTGTACAPRSPSARGSSS